MMMIKLCMHNALDNVAAVVAAMSICSKIVHIRNEFCVPNSMDCGRARTFLFFLHKNTLLIGTSITHIIFGVFRFAVVFAFIIALQKLLCTLRLYTGFNLRCVYFSIFSCYFFFFWLLLRHCHSDVQLQNCATR